MTRPFNFSAWPAADFSKGQPCVHPGKIYDRADNDGTSHVPQGGPAPYGRVLVAGISANLGTQASGGVAWPIDGMDYTHVDSCSLPDRDGLWLRNDAGVVYSAVAPTPLALPVDADGDLIVCGVGMWTEHNALANRRLEQPFGLGDFHYQPEKCGQIGVATQGRIWAYCETDIDKGDELFFRVAAAPASVSDGITLLGAFSNVGGADFQAFPYGSVFRPGPAGGAFVLHLNMQK